MTKGVILWNEREAFFVDTEWSYGGTAKEIQEISSGRKGHPNLKVLPASPLAIPTYGEGEKETGLVRCSKGELEGRCVLQCERRILKNDAGTRKNEKGGSCWIETGREGRSLLDRECTERQR